MKHVIILTITLMLSYGCASLNSQSAKNYTLATAEAVYSLRELNNSYSDIKAIVKSNYNIYTEEEKKALKRVSKTLESLRDTISTLTEDKNDISKLILKADKARVLLEKAEKTYITARIIIQNRYDELTPFQKEKLKQFDDQAISFSEAINTILSKPDGTDISKYISTSLQIAAGVAKIAALL